MPIPLQTPIVEHVGNGVTTVFAYPFAILDATDLKVRLGGVDVTTGFTVSGVGNRGGGTVTFSVAPGSGVRVLLRREVSLERDTDYQYAGDLREEVLDSDFDRVWMALQDQLVIASRTLRAPVGETFAELPAATSRALKVLGFNASGAPLLMSRTDDGGSALALDLLDPADPVKGAGQVGYDWALTFDELTAGYGIQTAANSVNVLRYIPPSEWAGILSYAYTYDCTTAINTALAAHDDVYLPKGGYRTTGAINVTRSTINLHGAAKYGSVIRADHTGNAINIATNNEPEVSRLYILRGTIAARGSRTGVGIRVFGDIAGGSSVQARVEHVRVDGFAKGLDLYGCFLSSFDDITVKRCDISYALNNSTNDSITFTRCKSNNDISQHVVGNGGAAECGGTFIACEFENGFKFPAFAVTGGTQFFLNFTNCYGYENNAGSDAGSTFNLMEWAVAGKCVIQGGGLSSSGKADARLMYGRRNASTVRWDITVDGVQLISRRVTGQDFDVDVNEANGDTLHISLSCNYRNTDNPNCEISLTSGSLWRANPNRTLNSRTSRIDFHNATNRVEGVANGMRLNTNSAGNNWQNNCLIFSSVSGANMAYLWPDATGKLRIKTGSAPTSDTDGTVVGTQT